MGLLRPEIEATLHFLSDSSRKVIPASADHFASPLCIDGDLFDCRLSPLAPQDIHPGDTVDVGIQFLHPELALPHVAVGVEFTLWEAGTIADGVVSRILPTAAGLTSAST